VEGCKEVAVLPLGELTIEEVEVELKVEDKRIEGDEVMEKISALVVVGTLKQVAALRSQESEELIRCELVPVMPLQVALTLPIS